MKPSEALNAHRAAIRQVVESHHAHNPRVFGSVIHGEDTPEFAARNPDIPWEDAYLIRSRVANGYFAVDLDLVWKTIQHDLPFLADRIRKLSATIDRMA